MKKTLVALAALAATSAFAQSSVTLSGLVDAGYGSVNWKGQSQSGITNNGRSTSTIQISGEEVIDGGYKASFKLNSDFDPTRSTSNSQNGAAYTASAGTWLNSEKFVALSGGFGTVKAGVINNSTLDTFGIGANFGTAFGSGFRYVVSTDVLGNIGTTTVPVAGVSQGTNGSAVRHDKSFSYTTPVIAGLSATAYAVKKNTNADSATFSNTQFNYNLAGLREYQIKYANGPLNIAYATQAQDNIGVLNSKQYKTKLNTLGANFTVGPIKLFAMSQAASADQDGLTNVYKTAYKSVGIDFTIGATTLKAQQGRLKNRLAADGSEDGTKLVAVGADYAFGKRTTLYARYERMTDAGQNLNASYPSNLGYNKTSADGNITRSAIGVVHTF